MPSNKAFTLLELLVVITIIGILSSVVIVSMSGSTDSATIAKGKAYAQQVHALLGANAVGVWNFDEGTDNTCSATEDICDYSGYGNHGTINKGTNGTGVDWVDSDIEGLALQFDGVDDRVGCGNKTSLNVASGDMTIESWVNLSALGRASTIISKWTPWILYIASNNKVTFYVRYDGTDHNVTSGTALTSIDRWYHLVTVYTVSDYKVRFYIDGILTASPSFGNAISSDTASSVQIGAYSSTYAPFSGLIDEVRIYAEALPSTETQKHYVQGLNKLLTNNAISEEEYTQRMDEFNQYLVSK
jgi:prepilin-type N-terminal cleavage/methylation domain-containing protein